MPRLVIDSQPVEVAEGATLLEAARQLGIDVPTLCTAGESSGWASCMVCIVDEAKSGRRLPACATKAAEGMDIVTDSDQLSSARQMAVELLMSEHLGDCEGPCRQVCPAGMDIPKMMRQIEEGHPEQARATVHASIALSSVVSRLCPAPCEKGCRRRQLERPLAIRDLVRHVSDQGLQKPPKRPALTGRRVAVVGAGPTGLAAAFHLLMLGHECVVIDAAGEAGGHLRERVIAGDLPGEIVDQEIALIAELGAEIRLGQEVAGSDAWQALVAEHDALVVAVGPAYAEAAEALGLATSKKGLAVSKETFQCSVEGIFSGGDAVRGGNDVVRSVTQGRIIAGSVNQLLLDQSVIGEVSRFNSFIGKLEEDERELLMSLHPSSLLTAPVGFDDNGQSADEAERCLHCECLKADSCRLRFTAELVDVNQTRFKGDDRIQLESPLQHDLVVFESGKCIRCGTCVRITEEHGEKLGLTFVGRGFNIRVGVPLNGTLQTALEHTAKLCAESCPTGAISNQPGSQDSE